MHADFETLTENLKQAAQEMGFILCGVTAAAQPERYHAFTDWLDNGYAGQMQYLDARREAYSHPSHVLDGCKTLVMLAYPYATVDMPQPSPGQAKVARYAWGEPDYHDHLFEKLKALRRWLVDRQPDALVRGVVDTAPLLEREFAESAGLGWIGKNTLLLNRQWGSYFFLGALLTNLELLTDPPTSKGYCGTCRACLDACPTQAFPEPYVLDARRCISYWTIEHRGVIDDDIAEQLDNWMFGCDICQEVCPWNRRASRSAQAIPQPMDLAAPADLIAVLDLDDAAFRERFRYTPLWRAKRRGVLRNACLIAGNQRYQPAIPVLERLLDDVEPLVQQAARWAMDRIRAA